MTTEIVQLCPLIPALEQELAQRFTVHRLFEAADKVAFLSERVLQSAASSPVAISACRRISAPHSPIFEIVAINGVGFDKVDLAEAKRRGFRVSNTPDVLTADVADLALGLVLAQARKLPQADQHVRTGQWLKGDMGLSTRVAGRRYGILALAASVRLSPKGWKALMRAFPTPPETVATFPMIITTASRLWPPIATC